MANSMMCQNIGNLYILTDGNNGMESKALEMRLHWCTNKIWVLCHDMDGRLMNPHAIYDVCGFRPTT